MQTTMEQFQNVPVRRLVWKLGVPAMLAQFLNVLYGIVDRFFVGQIQGEGELSLAAIGVCAPAVTAISAFAFMVGIGGSSIMSIKTGEGAQEEAQAAVNNGFFLLLLLSVAVTVLALVFRRPLLFLLGSSGEIYPFAESYFRICVLGTVAVLVGTGMNHYILAQGLARQGMLTVSLGAAVNILLDPILIFGLDMGIKGAAAATVIGQFCTLCYVLFLICRRNAQVRVRTGGFRLAVMKRILSIGSMSFLITLLDNLIVIFLNIVLQKYSAPGMGDRYIACAAVIQSFMLIVGLPAQGICSGCGTVFSYFYGIRDYGRIRQAFRYLLALCMVYIGALFIVVQVMPEYFVGLFLADLDSVQMASEALQKYTFALPGIAVQFAYVQGMTSMAKIAYAFPMSVFRKAVYIVCVFVLPLYTGVQNVFWAGSISDLIGATFTLVLFFAVANPKIKKSFVTEESI
ncbi:MAG: MATE family efflux transporter [Lachnospiraceae bacterium]|nr:MATE family efflux transporter [Lachnospiraceae bacterium]